MAGVVLASTTQRQPQAGILRRVSLYEAYKRVLQDHIRGI